MNKAMKAWLECVEQVHGVSDVVGGTFLCVETGEQYVEVYWNDKGFTVAEDDIQTVRPVIYDTEDKAWLAGISALGGYLASRQGKIHWRVKPYVSELKESDGFYPKDCGWRFYSRLYAEVT